MNVYNTTTMFIYIPSWNDDGDFANKIILHFMNNKTIV